MCVLESLVVMFMDDKIVLGSAITIFKARVKDFSFTLNQWLMNPLLCLGVDL
jgi:hypothetical protein